MVTNQTFDWTRFMNVVRRDFLNIWPRVGKTMVVMACAPVALWLLLSMVPGNNYLPSSVRGMMIFGLMSLFCMYAPSAMYRSCNLPKHGQYYAMLPASHLEKYLSMLLHCIIVLPVIFVAGAVAFDTVLSLLPFGAYNQYLWQSSVFEIFDTAWIDWSDESMFAKRFFDWLWLSWLLSFLCQQVIFIFSNTVFKSHKFVLTVLSLWAIQFVLGLIGMPLLILLGLNGGMEHFAAKVAAYPEQWMNAFVFGSMILDVLFCGVMLWWTYYRLKKMKY